MKAENKLLWIARISWPLLGGVTGAVVGLGGYYRLAHNADSFGSMLAQGYFVIFAIIGFFAGIACGVLVGGLTEKLLRNLGVWAASAVFVATVVNALVIWQLSGVFQKIYPGLRHPGTSSNVATQPKGSSPKKVVSENACTQPPPPENSKERMSWDAECR